MNKDEKCWNCGANKPTKKICDKCYDKIMKESQKDKNKKLKLEKKNCIICGKKKKFFVGIYQNICVKCFLEGHDNDPPK